MNFVFTDMMYCYRTVCNGNYVIMIQIYSMAEHFSYAKPSTQQEVITAGNQHLRRRALSVTSVTTPASVMVCVTLSSTKTVVVVVCPFAEEVGRHRGLGNGKCFKIQLWQTELIYNVFFIIAIKVVIATLDTAIIPGSWLIQWQRPERVGCRAAVWGGAPSGTPAITVFKAFGHFKEWRRKWGCWQPKAGHLSAEREPDRWERNSPGIGHMGQQKPADVAMSPSTPYESEHTWSVDIRINKNKKHQKWQQLVKARLHTELPTDTLICRFENGLKRGRKKRGNQTSREAINPYIIICRSLASLYPHPLNILRKDDYRTESQQ